MKKVWIFTFFTVLLLSSCTPTVQPSSVSVDFSFEPNDTKEFATPISPGRSPQFVIDTQDEDWLIYKPSKDEMVYMTIECSGIGDVFVLPFKMERMTLDEWNKTFRGVKMKATHGSSYFFHFTATGGRATCQLEMQETTL